MSGVKPWRRGNLLCVVREMSRTGKKPIAVPEGVEVKISGDLVEVSGPLGRLTQRLYPKIKVTKKDGQILVERLSNSKYYRALHGLARSLINNLIIGVTKGFRKELIITGMGYRAKLEGRMLNLQLGYSHPVKFPLPEGIEIKVEKQTQIMVSGIDKQLVGEVAAKIRRFRPPEPYKGKGIRYVDEHIKRKVGKAAAVSAGAPKGGK
jgi:large subunit ribosomal protein L6